MITQEEVQLIERGFSNLDMFHDVYSKEDSLAFYETWNKLWALMERENNFTVNLGVEDWDWQIHEWQDDLITALFNARLYPELISVCEQIQKIDFGDPSDNSEHESAKRFAAEAYQILGQTDKAITLYQESLEEDPQWGWGWIGYFRLLHETENPLFESILDDLVKKLEEGTPFRDASDLCFEISGEYSDLGNEDRAAYVSELAEKVQ